jgi:hypothetical protein
MINSIFKFKFVPFLFIVPVAFCCTLNVQCQSDAQWPFYLAFEDATGASDTVWLVMDESASSTTQDSILGEYPIILSEDEFNVWTYTLDWQEPYDCFADNFGPSDLEIYANNYLLPITVCWDTTLFQADVLHSVLGFGANSAVFDGAYFGAVYLETGYSLLGETSTVMPPFDWGGEHFPLFFSVAFGEGDPLRLNERRKSRIDLFPNPANDDVTIKSRESVDMIEIFNLAGEIVLTVESPEQSQLKVEHLKEGLYIIKVLSAGEQSVEKLVVSH